MVAAQQQDFWGQFEVAEYDKPQYDWGQYEEVPQNQHALESSLNELPEGDPYVQTQKYQTEQLANMLFTQEEKKAIEDKGQIGWWEYARNFADLSDAVPFYGTGKQIAESGKTYAIAKKLENGEEVSEADKTYMVEYLKKYAETQLRGTTWGAKGASMLIQAPAFIGEFIATAGVGATVGKGAAIAGVKAAGAGATKAAIKAGSKIATSKALSTIAGREAVETIGTKAALEVSAELAGKAAAQQAVLVPMYAVQHYNERKISDGLNLTDKGNDRLYDVQKADSEANWAKSFGIGEIEILSELSGGLLGYMAGGITKGITTAASKVGGKIATTNTARGISATSAKIYNSLPKDVRVKLEASARLADKIGSKLNTVSEKLKQPAIGFHGVAEEWGEERLGDVLKFAFDLDENEGYSFDQFGSAIFPSWQQSLLELGVFSIVGGGSLATRTVFNDLINKGYSEKEATTITQNLSEIEKENMADEILGEVKINEDIKEQEVIKEQVKLENKLLQGGVTLNVNEQGEEIKEAPKTLTDYKKDILSNKFNSDLPLETVKNRYKNRYFTTVLPSMSNDLIMSERSFDGLINQIYKNPSIVNEQSEIDKLENELDNIVEHLPEELIQDYYNRFYRAISSASEYSILKESRSKKQAAELYDMADTEKPLPKMSDNYLKDLNTYSDNLYRETNADGAISLIDASSMNSLGEVYLSNAKDLAKGQGENQGIILEFSSNGIQGQVNTNKPNWKFAYENNQAEFIAKNNDKNKFIDNLKSVTITDKEVLKTSNGKRLQKILNSNEFVKNENGDGTITYFKNNAENPNIYYDISDETPEKTAEPKTLKEVEKVAAEEAEQEEEEKGIKGLFKDFKETIQNFIEPLYTETVDRFAPIQNTVKRANKKGANLGIDITDKNWIENPYNLARMYSGIANKIWQHFKENTTLRTEDGTQKITGEGFGKIIEDLYEQTKDIESDKETQLKDFEDYLIAKRYLLDLKDREGYEATEEQKLKAIEDMARIAEKYGDKMGTLEKLAERVYEYNRRTLHLLVDSGNMSQETYDKIIADNPHHISYKRVMDDNYGDTGLSFAKGKFTDAKSPVKKIRGSEREIQSIYKSTLEDTMRIIDVAERNYIARKTAELQKYLPEEIKPIKPLMRKTTAKVKVTYDAKMRKQLEEAIEFFGRTFENVKSIKTPTGYALGSYSEEEKAVRKKLGSQDRTLAHEVGHMLDYALDVENKIKKNAAIMKEISQLAEDRFQSTVKLEDGEYITEEARNTEKYKSYVKSNKEMIANMFDLYFTSRDYVKRVAPETAKFIDGLFKGEYKFLNDIRPSSEAATEEIEQDVWTRSPEKPSKNAIGYYEDGKLKFVEVEPNLMRSIEDLNPKQYGMIAQAVDKLFKTSSDWLRAGATLNPEFILRNPIRDIQEAWFNVNGFNPLIDVPKGLMSVIGKNNSSLYKEWQREGGSFNSYMELNEKTINEAVKLYDEKKPLIWKALSFVPNTLEKLSSTLEEATRLGIYNAMLRKGLTPTQAAFMSREGTLDFARGGRFIKQANRYLTFLNAGVQGTDRVLRTIINNPKQALKVGMTMAMGQILLSGYYLYLAPDDDRKEYLEIPEYVKNVAYVFKVGGKWWKIPRPFAPGYIFEAIPEKFITWLATNDKPEGLKLFNFAKDLFTAASPITDPSDFIPPMLKVWIENTSNHSFFTDRQIYPEYLNQYEAKERYTKNTSETAKLLGEKLNMSPALIENALRGQFGNAAKYALDMGDYMQNGIKKLVGEEVNEKPKDIANAWVVRGFAVKEPIGNQSQSLNTFYKNYKELSQIHSTYNKKKNESRQEAQEYQNAHREELRQFKSVDRTYKDIQELRKKSDKILKNSNLDGKEKAEKIKMLERQMTEKAQNANEFIKE